MSRDGATDAYSLILDAIDRGRYPPGARLVETELAERFGRSLAHVQVLMLQHRRVILLEAVQQCHAAPVIEQPIA